MQSGAWAAIGIPDVASAKNRKHFYSYRWVGDRSRTVIHLCMYDNACLHVRVLTFTHTHNPSLHTTTSNWLYQVGVFLSRSSGLLLPPSRPLLWVMPALQCALLVFFVVDAALHFWYVRVYTSVYASVYVYMHVYMYMRVYICKCMHTFTRITSHPNQNQTNTKQNRYSWSLLLLCLCAGLLGGAVYVQGFSLLSRDTPPEKRELALVTASIADTLGIMASDVMGLVIQVCCIRACVLVCGWMWRGRCCSNLDFVYKM